MRGAGAFGASAGLEDVDAAGAAAGRAAGVSCGAAAASAGAAAAPLSVVSGAGGADFTAVQADSAHKAVKRSMRREAQGSGRRILDISGTSKKTEYFGAL